MPLLYALCPYPVVAVHYACQLLVLSCQSAVLAEFVVSLLLYYYLLNKENLIVKKSPGACGPPAPPSFGPAYGSTEFSSDAGTRGKNYRM